ncbi:MAG: hypothetical protein KY468_17205 [Armatimonadetes bacterium]|nr:hypothetical protein [Armatimonadota bacterium]
MFLFFLLSLLLGLGVGIGWVLHWLLPSIEFGMAVLIGVVALAFSFHAILSLTLTSLKLDEEKEPLIVEMPRDMMNLVSDVSARSGRKRKSGNR